ncbi:hypothetical protein V1478_011877, partial [Vespula squamosa]
SSYGSHIGSQGIMGTDGAFTPLRSETASTSLLPDELPITVYAGSPLNFVNTLSHGHGPIYLTTTGTSKTFSLNRLPSTSSKRSRIDEASLLKSFSKRMSCRSWQILRKYGGGGYRKTKRKYVSKLCCRWKW